MMLTPAPAARASCCALTGLLHQATIAFDGTAKGKCDCDKSEQNPKVIA
jgi:hypothetical protein